MDVKVKKKRMRRAKAPNWRKLQVGLSDMDEKKASPVALSAPGPTTPPIPMTMGGIPSGPEPGAMPATNAATPPSTLDNISNTANKVLAHPATPYVGAAGGGALGAYLLSRLTRSKDDEEEKRSGCGPKHGKPTNYRIINSESGERKKMAATAALKVYIADLYSRTALPEKQASRNSLTRLLNELDSGAPLAACVSKAYPEKTAADADKTAKLLVRNMYRAYKQAAREVAAVR